MVNFIGTILGIILIIVVLKIAMKHKDYWENLDIDPNDPLYSPPDDDD